MLRENILNNPGIGYIVLLNQVINFYYPSDIVNVVSVVISHIAGSNHFLFKRVKCVQGFQLCAQGLHIFRK